MTVTKKPLCHLKRLFYVPALVVAFVDRELHASVFLRYLLEVHVASIFPQTVTYCIADYTIR